MIIAINPNEIPKGVGAKGFFRSKLSKDMIAFTDSGHPAGKVELYGHDPKNAASNMASFAKRHGLPLRVVRRKNEVFVVRTDVQPVLNPTDTSKDTEDSISISPVGVVQTNSKEEPFLRYSASPDDFY